jgi:hypothetical protein
LETAAALTSTDDELDGVIISIIEGLIRFVDAALAVDDDDPHAVASVRS